MSPSSSFPSSDRCRILGRRVDRPIGMSLRSLMLVTVSVLCVSCAELLATAIPAATTILEAAALNYGGPYAGALKGLVDVLGTAALSGVQPSVDSAPALEMDVAFVSDSAGDSEGEIRTLQNLAEVREGERMRLFFRPSQPCHVFVVSIDTTGGFRLLYPDSLTVSAPVAARTETLLPEPTSWFQFDGSAGLEHIHIVATRRSPDVLVDRISQIVQAKLGVRSRSADAKSVTVPFDPSGPGGGVLSRGAETGAPFVTAGARGQPIELTPTRHVARAGAQDLVVTQIFRHR